MASLALSLLAAPPAQAGHYAGPTYSGGSSTGGSTPGPAPTPSPDGNAQGGWGGGNGFAYGCPGGGASLSGSASCTGNITATFTWVHDGSGQNDQNDPPPTAEIVEEGCDTNWQSNQTAAQTGYTVSGKLGNPFWSGPDPSGPYGGDEKGVKYSAQGGSTISTSASPTASTSASPTASATGSGGPPGTSVFSATASVNYGLGLVSAVSVSLGGTLTNGNSPVLDSSGNQQVLTGQQITAGVAGIPSGFKVTKYTWAVGGSTFKNYDPTLASNQLTPLGSTDLTGPAAGGTSVAPLAFYDSAAETLTVSCAVTLLAPDGKTTLSLTATSPPFKVYKPTASWGVDPKTVPVNGSPDNTNTGFHDNSKTPSQSYGAVTFWYPVTISMPSAFTNTGGQGCFAQISTPVNSVTRTPTGAGATTYNIRIQNAQGMWVAPGTGLDKGFPYPEGYTIDASGNITDTTSDSTFTVGNIGGSGDAPSGAENPPDNDNGGTIWTSGMLNEKFTTWLMYKPPGGVWIPLQMATWSVTGNATGGPNKWSATGTYSAPSPSSTNNSPQWGTKIVGPQYWP